MNLTPKGLSFTDAPRGRREEQSEEGRACGGGRQPGERKE